MCGVRWVRLCVCRVFVACRPRAHVPRRTHTFRADAENKALLCGGGEDSSSYYYPLGALHADLINVMSEAQGQFDAALAEIGAELRASPTLVSTEELEAEHRDVIAKNPVRMIDPREALKSEIDEWADESE